MAIKKRPAPQAAPEPAEENPALEQRAEAFGRGAYAPTSAALQAVLDPNAPVGPQGTLFRYNEYQKALLKESAEIDRRSMQKLLESIVWPELERRRAERNA